jgi:glycosyltransferase involved in cell wall biosynthesis
MHDRLRFCMITTFYPPYNFGGDGVFVHRLSNELARRGHHVEVIHCVDAYRLAADPPTGKYHDHPNVTVHGLSSRFGLLSPLVTHQTGHPGLKSTRIREVLSQGFDVIHYHNVSLIGGPKILEYGRAVKLYTMHDYWLVCPTSVMFRFNRAPCTRPHCLACGLVYRRPPQWWRYRGLMARSIKHIDAFIAPSRFSKALHHRMGLDAHVVHLPSFAASDESPWESGALADGSPVQPYFLFVGRLEKLKGLQTLIPVFRSYRKAQLLVAGTGSYEPALKHLARSVDNIRFLGHVASPELQRLYRTALGVIVPSICYEAAPLVILEAFRQGVPVIVRNLGGMPEIADESGGGLVFDTEAELVAAMDRLYADRSYRDEMGRRGYTAYEEKWTAETHLERYLDLIGQIEALGPRSKI